MSSRSILEAPAVPLSAAFGGAGAATAHPALGRPAVGDNVRRIGWTMPEDEADERLRNLLDEYGHVLRWAIRRVAARSSALDPDDIEQEARLRVWRALRRRTTFKRPESYLYRVAVTTALDALRRLRTRREEPLPAAEESTAPADLAGDADCPEEAALRNEEIARVRRAIGDLGANRRRAVKLYLQGFNSAEIGRLRGWSEPKARNLVYRGLADLRARLETEETTDALE